MKTLPNFLVIGAAKSGTTSLHQYLGQHPEIFMSKIKEPNFFAFEGENLNFNGPNEKECKSSENIQSLRSRINRGKYNFSITNIKDYYSLFDEVNNEKAIGESSPCYLYVPKAAKRIKHYVPDAKLIVILRNPVDRAYSKFLQFIRDGLEPLMDFSKGLQAEKKRIANNWSPPWHYKERGFYYKQLKRYYKLFKPSQIRVYLYDEFKNNTVKVLQDIFQFLEVDDNFVPNINEKHNVSVDDKKIPKNNFLHQFLTNQNLLKSVIKSIIPYKLACYMKSSLLRKNTKYIKNERPQLPEHIREQLTEEYREDIIKLQDLIKRDLSGWLKK